MFARMQEEKHSSDTSYLFYTDPQTRILQLFSCALTNTWKPEQASLWLGLPPCPTSYMSIKPQGVLMAKLVLAW